MPKYLLVSLLFTTHLLFGQSEQPQKLQIGPIAGLNIARIASNYFDFDQGISLGFNAGAKLIYLIGKKAAINGLFVYSEKGSNYQFANPKEKLEQSFYYFDIPLFYTYKFGGEKLSYYPIIGLHNGLLFKAQSEIYEPLTSGQIGKRKVDLVIGGPEAYRYEIGYTFGVGGQLKITTNSTFFLDVRSTQAVSNVRGSHFLPCGGCSSYRNVFLSLNTGVLF